MRNLLKNLKKQLDDKERSVKAAVATAIADEVKALCQANPNVPVMVRELKADSNTKVGSDMLWLELFVLTQFNLLKS